MRSAKGRKRAKRKIDEHRVLNLEVKMRHAVDEGPKRGAKIKFRASRLLMLGVKASHAVGEGPKKGKTKNWRASCTQFRGQNEACGRRRAEKGPNEKLALVVFSF